MTLIQEGVAEKDVNKLGPGLKEAEKLRLRGPMVETGKNIYEQETERNSTLILILYMLNLNTMYLSPQ